jgi:hypothetical protein
LAIAITRYMSSTSAHAQADLLEHGGLSTPSTWRLRMNAHRQHPLERARHRLLVAGGQQVGEVLERDAQAAHVGQLAVHADLPGLGRAR